MPKTKKDAAEELKQPVLNLERAPLPVELPDEVPDVFEEAEYEEVIAHGSDIEIVSLMNDIEVFLKINDVESAKREYKKLLKLFNGLPLDRKKGYFDRVNRIYDEIKHPKAVQKEFKKSLPK